MKKLQAVAILVIAVSGCTDFGGPYTPPRVMPGSGIDGVVIGMSREKAREVLGKPDGGGIWDGSHASGEMDIWEKGPHAGLFIQFNGYFVGTTYQMGPVDYISARAPFAGTTPEGIGVSSRIETVLRAYPVPSYRSIDSTGTGILVYCVSGKYLIISLTDSLTSWLGTGYNDPPKPGDFPFYCP